MRQATGIFCMVIAVIMFFGSEGAVSRGVFKDPAHPGKCVLEGLILSAGQTARHPVRCERIICSNDSNVQIHTCGSVGLPPGKKFGKFKNPKADYPVCCDKEIIDA